MKLPVFGKSVQQLPPVGTGWSIPGPSGENRAQKQGHDVPGSVNPDEAKIFEEAAQPGVFKTRIRTKWYRVNVTVHASGLLAEVFRKVMEVRISTAWLPRQYRNPNSWVH